MQNSICFFLINISFFIIVYSRRKNFLGKTLVSLGKEAFYFILRQTVRHLLLYVHFYDVVYIYIFLILGFEDML